MGGVALLLVPALAWAKAPPPSSLPASSAVQTAIDRIQADASYQLDLPAPVVDQPTELPQWLSALFGWMAGDGAWLINGLFIVLMAAAALFILYLTVPAVREFIDRLLARWRTQTDDDANEQTWRPDEGAARNLLADADAMAADGRFAEAVHLLLGHSVIDIDRRRPDLLRPALTARAIALLDDLPGAARTAFAQIAAIVERSLWARQAIESSDWAAARAAYTDFAFGQHWRVAR